MNNNMIPTQLVYDIPDDVGVVWVSDFFVSDLNGGAELTHEAIIKKCPSNNKKVFRLHSYYVTEDLIEKNKDKYWILGNLTKLSRTNAINIAVTVKRFSIVECDYLYCIFHSSHLHKLQTSQECDCHNQDQGRFVQGLFKRAEHVFFMSEGQLAEYKRLFPAMNKWQEGKLVVLSSVFTDETLDYLNELHEDRNEKLVAALKNKIDSTLESKELSSGDNKLLNTWAVLGGGTWIKNQQEIEQYCKTYDIDYEVFGGNLEPKDFLKRLSEYRGLVFMPASFDTCPRLVIEAKLLGLNLDLNKFVQHQEEFWFDTEDREIITKYLKERGEKFWEIVKI